MTRHSLCAALCTVALTLSPALALAQAAKTAPKAAAPQGRCWRREDLHPDRRRQHAVRAGHHPRQGGRQGHGHAEVRERPAEDGDGPQLRAAEGRHGCCRRRHGRRAARDTTFVSPKSKAQIIAASALAGGGETVTVEFTAPAAGKYQFICTFPAHFQAGMVGQLIVE